MRANLYPRLAWDGIRKNKRFYAPYLLTCIGMVMMCYILRYLASMPRLKEMPGGSTMTMILDLGFLVLALFAVIFLFYTNSFLMRRRQKEFGLYNMLGMGKKHLGLLLLWETGILFVLSVTGGLLLGILLSKLAELCMIMLMGGEASYTLRIDPEAAGDTCVMFLPVFALIFAKGLLQIRKSSAVSLIKSETVGEKPPRANYVLGLAGVLILAGAYYIALSIESPLAALTWFFVAVCMVIFATYLLFIAGSVTLCRLLQKNRRYYYQPNHFVSVSSMVYRMKRNGAGLASICILSTMVLVTMMGAGSLYAGKEDSLHARYPHDFAVAVDFLTEGENQRFSEEKAADFYAQIDAVLDSFGAAAQNAERIVSTGVPGVLKDGNLVLDPDIVDSADAWTAAYVTQIDLISLSSYNRCMGTSKTLAPGEVFLYCVRGSYDAPTITLADGTVLTVKEQLPDIMGRADAERDITPTVFLVTDEMQRVIDSFNWELTRTSDEHQCRVEASCSFDVELSEQRQIELREAILARLRVLNDREDTGFYSYDVSCRAAERAEFYGTFGGVFFLGMFLSLLFLAATVLIIYYKQVTEGCEDEARFSIMRKVGMTAADIRRSINSQMLTVFFLPLIMAAVHTAFAFPMVQKLLALFNLRNVWLSVLVTGIAIVIFGVFYGAVYKITSNAYYAIVSAKQQNG